jgi:hypothetical protein
MSAQIKKPVLTIPVHKQASSSTDLAEKTLLIVNANRP